MEARETWPLLIGKEVLDKCKTLYYNNKNIKYNTKLTQQKIKGYVMWLKSKKI